ncbi:hypothetical protein NGM33_28780 [Nocardiopsis dassonvillei]|uniref:hypothetical protein n=1 Tax=Nocardiopsis dassonvillei TaxID=2014 RepID=UPI0020A3B4CE|nr:hypothetical protein [Nocardiopsis dassonvillei]MCP3017333.1 hypothetical protein [Nocardiopsis dassonvillei]
MTSHHDFIRARLDEDTTIPKAVKTALSTLAETHTGDPYCEGCPSDPHDGGAVWIEECEQARTIARIWAQHPDHDRLPVRAAWR